MWETGFDPWVRKIRDWAINIHPHTHTHVHTCVHTHTHTDVKHFLNVSLTIWIFSLVMFLFKSFAHFFLFLSYVFFSSILSFFMQIWVSDLCHFSFLWKTSFNTTSGRSESEVKVLIAQSCPTLCDLMDCNPTGSSVHGILQARILEWVHSPLQGILPTQRSSPGLLHCRQILYHLSHQGS